MHIILYLLYRCLLVAVGGGCGSLARFGLLHLHPSSLLPNAIACLILGFYFGHSQGGTNVTMGLLLATGFCGGLSTFSTLIAELYRLVVSGRYTMAMLYTAASLAFGLAMFAAGAFLSRLGK